MRAPLKMDEGPGFLYFIPYPNHDRGSHQAKEEKTMIRCLVALTLFLSLFTGYARGEEFDWSTEDRAVWNKAIKRVITTPPCCGACPLLRMEDGNKIYGYLTQQNPTPEGRELFEKYDEKILEAVKYFDPGRSHVWTQRFIKKENRP